MIEAQPKDSESNPGRDPPRERQPILLVTGLLGAGKTTALKALEDLGWETIDNFPVRLLDRLLVRGETRDTPLAIGFDCRTRGFAPSEIIAQVKALAARDDLDITTMFIDCSSRELERRYNETRSRHRLARERPLAEGIAAERELLEPLRRWAEIVIDTSELNASELQQHIRQLFDRRTNEAMTITVSSFGFARGMPPLADLVFDMRFLRNPHWDEALRARTGLDEEVGAFIESDEGFGEAFERIRDLLLTLLPRYRAQGKPYVHIAFGCTGGRHRSVYTAERIAQVLRAAGFSPTVRHRNLASRSADEIEGNRP